MLRFRWELTVLKIVTAAFEIPVYLVSPATWNARRALIVSKGYVKATAVTPAPAPAMNLSVCLGSPNFDKYWKIKIAEWKFW